MRSQTRIRLASLSSLADPIGDSKILRVDGLGMQLQLVQGEQGEWARSAKAFVRVMGARRRCSPARVIRIVCVSSEPQALAE